MRFARKRPDLDGSWEAPAWAVAETLDVACFRPEGTGHRPRTEARLLWDLEGISGIFRVEDRYVRTIRTEFGEPVYKDSCVEFFVEPLPGRGYLNLEFNAGGALLVTHVVDPVRTPAGLRDARPLDEAEGRSIGVHHSLPAVVEPELADPTVWTLQFFLPFSLLAKYTGARVPRAGTEWRGNLYKCGDETSHPHWASWSPLDDRNFHLPHCFGALRFV